MENLTEELKGHKYFSSERLVYFIRKINELDFAVKYFE